MKSTAIVTAMIALFVAIGMTGSAMAALVPVQTTVHTTTDIDVSGTGSFSEYAFGPEMSDYFVTEFKNGNVAYDADVKLYDYVGKNSVYVDRLLDANGWNWMPSSFGAIGVTSMDLEGVVDETAYVATTLNASGNGCTNAHADLDQTIALTSSECAVCVNSWYDPCNSCYRYTKADVDTIRVDTDEMHVRGRQYEGSVTAGLTNATSAITVGDMVNIDAANGFGKYIGDIYIYRVEVR